MSGRITGRQRLRRATRESLATPVFSSFVDCAPWVIGGLWHGELATLTAENPTLANHLRADLQRITRSANDALKLIKRARRTLRPSAHNANLGRAAVELRGRSRQSVGVAIALAPTV